MPFNILKGLYQASANFTFKGPNLISRLGQRSGMTNDMQI